MSSPNQVPALVEQRICRLREELPLDNDAQAIFYRLQWDGITPLPSVRTVQLRRPAIGVADADRHKRDQHLAWTGLVQLHGLQFERSIG